MPRRLSASASHELAAYLSSSPVFALDADERAALERFTRELAAWLVSAPRFRAFADAHRDKIRRKLRLARDAPARMDVRAELLVARQLLLDSSLAVAFEPGGAARGGPDFTVTYRSGSPFNLEVTRPRRLTGVTAARPVLGKLRQLPTGAASIVLLVLPADVAAPDMTAAIRAVRGRADAKDEGFFIRRGFDGTRGFYARFIRLGAVVTWPEGGAPGAWVNQSARTPVPGRALRACVDALARGEPTA